MRPRISGPLLYWLLRQTLPVTALFLITAVFFLFIYGHPLNNIPGTIFSFVAIHSIFIAFCLGRSRSGWFAFIHTRGFSRTLLGWHYMFAALAAGLIVWGPASLLVVTGIRAYVQDHAFETAYSIILPALEHYQPLPWLGFYAILSPILQYAWIRRAQPTQGWNNGAVLVCLWILSCFYLISIKTMLTWLAGTIVAAVAWLGCVWLYRRMEVRT